MDTTRIAELLHPFFDTAIGQRPTTDDLANISTYINMLLRWNSRINLTAIRDAEEIVTRHFGESFFAARHLFPVPSSRDLKGRGFSRADTQTEKNDGASAPAPRVADLGSGAGFPGIPIKLWAPNIELTLIESNQKKVAFLREIVRALTLTDVNVFAGRAEQLTEPIARSQADRSAISPHGSGFDLVTLRAVERFTDTLPIAASLLAAHGQMALLIGASQVEPAKTLTSHLTWDEPITLPAARSRVLLIGRLPSGYQK